MTPAWLRRAAAGLRLAVTLLTAIPLPAPRHGRAAAPDAPPRPTRAAGTPAPPPPGPGDRDVPGFSDHGWFPDDPGSLFGTGPGQAGPWPDPGRGAATGTGPSTRGPAAQPVPASRPGSPAAAAPSRQAAGDAMALAPAVGLLLGAVAAAVLYVFQRYWHAGPLLGSALAIVTLAALTRALHLDGLADLADGLGSRRPAAGALEIMRRSDIGPFGVTVLLLLLLVQVTALTQADSLGRGVTSVAAAAMCGRLALAWACGRGIPAARADGLGALVAGSLHPLIPAILSAAALIGTAAYGLIYPAAIAVGLACGLALTWLAVRRLGGITGDVLGAVTEVATAACLLVLALS